MHQNHSLMINEGKNVLRQKWEISFMVDKEGVKEVRYSTKEKVIFNLQKN